MLHNSILPESILPKILQYLDPGSGSILLQLLIAGLAGIGLFLGTSWKRIKRFFQRNKDVKHPEDDSEEYDD